MNRAESMNENSEQSWTRFLVPAVFLGLFAIPVLYYGWNSEVARWTAARGQLEYDGGRIDGGISFLESAVAKAPHDIDLQLLLAEKLMVHGRAAEALKIIEDVIPVSTNPRPALRMKANCLLYLERPDEALITLKGISDYLPPADYKQPDRLNELAYFQALAKQDLEAAKENIDRAIALYQTQNWWLENLAMPLADQTLVSTVMIARVLGQQEQVIELLDNRIKYNHELLRELLHQSSEFVYEKSHQVLPFTEQAKKDMFFYQQTSRSQKQNLAILFTVRALVSQDLNDFEEANLDRQRVAMLGFEPQRLVDQMPDNWDLMNLMYTGAMFLDTRAMVANAKQPGGINGVRDLDLSVAAIQILGESNNGKLQNTIRDDRGARFQKVQIKRHEVVIRKHRARILQQRGQSELAEKDFKRIEELGFNRNEVIF